jgi:hypothetical protein
MPVAIRPGASVARVLLAACAALLLALLLARAAPPAHAQIDPSTRSMEIWQAGEKVGEVYVPARPAGATTYPEHWVLFPTYVYPSGDGKVEVALRPGGPRYESEADFFARVPFARGSRYVKVQSAESDRLPGR